MLCVICKQRNKSWKKFKTKCSRINKLNFLNQTLLFFSIFLDFYQCYQCFNFYMNTYFDNKCLSNSTLECFDAIFSKPGIFKMKLYWRNGSFLAINYKKIYSLLIKFHECNKIKFIKSNFLPAITKSNCVQYYFSNEMVFCCFQIKNKIMAHCPTYPVDLPSFYFFKLLTVALYLFILVITRMICVLNL